MKLSVLAHQCTRIDKYRPETCCIVGMLLLRLHILELSLMYLLANYHSARGEIQESVEYFKRALELDRDYHLAWTLLGHDYIELKNMHAAIECYRRAIGENGTLILLAKANPIGKMSTVVTIAHGTDLDKHMKFLGYRFTQHTTTRKPLN